MKKNLYILLMMVLVLSMVACSQPAEEVAGEVANEEVAEEQPAPVEEKAEEVTEEPAQPAKEVKIVAYMSGPETMLKKLEAAFEEEHGDVVDMTIMGCGQLRSKVWTESQAGDIQADVFWGSNPLVYNQLDALGKLMPLKLSNVKDVKDEFIWVDKNYQLVNERFMVIYYNKETLDTEIPKSFKDLENEAYKGMLVKADASQSSTAFAIASSLYQIMGNDDAYFKALKTNDIMLTKSNGLVPSTLLEGQASVGIAPYDALVRLKKKGKKEGYEVPLKAVWPSEGAISIQRPIAVSKSATRSEEETKIAMQFANFMLSKKAQKITDSFGMGSVRKDIHTVYAPEGSKLFVVDWELGVENEEAVKTAYQKIFH